MLNLCINFHPYLIFYFLLHQLYYQCFLGGEQPNFLYFKCLQFCDTDIRQDELMLLPKQIFESCSVAFPWNEDMIFYFFLIKYDLSYNIFLFHCKNCFFFVVVVFCCYGWYIFKCLLFSSVYMIRETKLNAAEGMDFFFQVPVYENENCFYVRSNSLRYAIHTYIHASLR